MTDVESLIAEGEGQRLEFKTSFAEENRVIEALCAFANAEGGTVLIGVTDQGSIRNVDLGKNTQENFANKLRHNTDPPLQVSIDILSADGKTLVTVQVKPVERGKLQQAFGRSYIRIGKTNHVMGPEELRRRFLAGQTDWSEERDRPRFDLPGASLRRTEREFEPEWTLQQVSGDYVATVEWRLRGARLQPPMEWQSASGASLKGHGRRCIATFNLSVPPGEDDLLPEDQIGFEIRFQWRGKARHELHRFRLSKSSTQQKALWDIGREILPPLYTDE